MDDVTVLLPLRDPGAGKTRLAGTLSAAGRARLTRAMATDVLAALRGAGVEHILALTAGSGAAEEAARLGVEAVADPPGADLNTAVRHAVGGLATAVVAVVMADLPRLTPGEVEALLGVEAPVVVAPTTDGGTGGLVRRPGGVIATAYGPGSAQRHLALARLAGLRGATLRSPGLAHDVDTTADLCALQPGEVGEATRAALASLHVGC